MLAKHIAAGIAGSLLLASAAFAAESSSSTYQGDWRTSKVVGLNVYNDQNQNVGSINDLLMDKSGGIKAAVLSVGGFLGMGSRYVAIPFEKLKFSEQPVPSTGAGASNAPAKPSSGTTTGSASNQPATSSKPNPWYPDHAMFNATKDELQAMPEFKYTTE